MKNCFDISPVKCGTLSTLLTGNIQKYVSCGAPAMSLKFAQKRGLH